MYDEVVGAGFFKCFGIFLRFQDHQVDIAGLVGGFPDLFDDGEAKLILGTNLPSITSGVTNRPDFHSAFCILPPDAGNPRLIKKGL